MLPLSPARRPVQLTSSVPAWVPGVAATEVGLVITVLSAKLLKSLSWTGSGGDKM
jgi:hypothetical protein